MHDKGRIYEWCFEAEIGLRPTLTFKRIVIYREANDEARFQNGQDESTTAGE